MCGHWRAGRCLWSYPRWPASSVPGGCGHSRSERPPAGRPVRLCWDPRPQLNDPNLTCSLTPTLNRTCWDEPLRPLLKTALVACDELELSVRNQLTTSNKYQYYRDVLVQVWIPVGSMALATGDIIAAGKIHPSLDQWPGFRGWS